MARSRAWQASTARRVAENISRGRINRDLAILRTLNWQFLACETSTRHGSRRLQSDDALQQPRVLIHIERHEAAGFRIAKKQWIGDVAWIETCADQILLLPFEGFGGLQRRTQSDEDRAGVGRQPSQKMIAEFVEIETGV